MNVRRIALQGLIVGAGALSIASQGFQPLEGGGALPHRVAVPPSLIDAQRMQIIGQDDILLLIAGSIAAGLLT